MTLLLISVALALDAFGVALSLGLNRGIRKNNKIYFTISFAFFQFFFAFLGGGLGEAFNLYITTIPSLVGGTIIALVGVLMIKEGFNKNVNHKKFRAKMYFILGISVSIDALVVGFTILNTKNILLLLVKSMTIGIVTMIIVAIGFYIAKYLKRINLVSCYAEYIGGIILLIFGLRMMFL